MESELNRRRVFAGLLISLLCASGQVHSRSYSVVEYEDRDISDSSYGFPPDGSYKSDDDVEDPVRYDLIDRGDGVNGFERSNVARYTRANNRGNSNQKVKPFENWSQNNNNNNNQREYLNNGYSNPNSGSSTFGSSASQGYQNSGISSFGNNPSGSKPPGWNNRGSNSQTWQNRGNSDGSSYTSSPFQIEEPKTEGYRGSVLASSNPQKTQGSTFSNNWNSEVHSSGSGKSNSNQKLISGFQNGHLQTEGYTALESSANKETDGNKWNANSNKWNSNSASDSKKIFNNKPIGVVESGWNSGFEANEDQTEGYRGFGYTSSSVQGNSWNSDSGTWNSKKNPQSQENNKWNSNSRDERPMSGSSYGFGTSSNAQGNVNKPNQNWNSHSDGKSPYQSNTGGNTMSDQNSKKSDAFGFNAFGVFGQKPGKPNGSNSNFWGTTARPPPKEKEKPVTEKPTTVKKPVKVDWDKLEKQNKEEKLTLDLTQLWQTNSRGNSNQRQREGGRSKRTHAFSIDEYGTNCHCTGRLECDPLDRVDVTFIFKRSRPYIQDQALECIKQGKVCCSVDTSSQDIDQKQPDHPLTLNLEPVCGRTSNEKSENVSPGDLTEYGAFPWSLKLVGTNEDGIEGETLCGAALIHSSLALTSASCALLISGGRTRLRAGEWNSVFGYEPQSVGDRKIEKVFLHPRFDFVSRTNDLAVIVLDQPMDQNLDLIPVCLPTEEDAWDVSRCVITAWTQLDGDLEPPMLREIDLVTIKQGKCRNSSDIYQHDGGNIEDTSYICAQTKSEDLCVADIGASLMCPLYGSNKLVQIGFSSPNSNCDRFYKTSTFTSILESIDWITHLEATYLYHKRMDFLQ